MLRFAQRAPSEMKITKIDPWVVLGRPGGVRGAGEGRFEGSYRSANLNWRCRTSALDPTHQRFSYDKGGGFTRSVHSAPWAVDNGQLAMRQKGNNKHKQEAKAWA